MSAISIIIYLFLKRLKCYNFAQFVLVVFSLLSTFYPIMQGIFVFANYNLYGHLKAPLVTYIYIEILFYCCWIFALGLFLTLAHLLKYKSITKKHADSEMEKAITQQEQAEESLEKFRTYSMEQVEASPAL